MPSLKWKSLGKPYKHPYYFDNNDMQVCHFAREYISGAGYKITEDNNIIQNFKIPPSKTHRLKYKKTAIEQFAKDLSDLFDGDEYITFMPSSKCCSDVTYDSRMEQTLACLKVCHPNIKFLNPIIRTHSAEAYHESKKTRTIEDIYNAFEWKGLPANVNDFVVIDDVLTTGAHFKAYQRLLAERAPNVKLYGVFWAISIFP